MPRITPFLWFDNQAEDAVNFYTSIFRNGRLKNLSRYGDAGPGPKGSVMTATFELDGQEFIALNGGSIFTFNEAISFSIRCESQEEVDYYWSRLSEGGEEGQCGWLKDKFGISWQVVPAALMKLLQDPDPQKSTRVTEAMLKMRKIDISLLEKAHDGTSP